MHTRQVVDYVTMAVIWGVSFLLLVRVVDAFGPIGAVTFRCFVASAVLWLIARASKRVLNFQSSWRHLAVIGATTVAGQLLGMSYGTPRIGTAMAAIIVATIPLFSMVIGHLTGVENVSSAGKAGVLIGAVGMVCLVGFPAVPVTHDFVIGVCASTFAALSAAIGSIYAARHLAHVGSYEQTVGAFLIGGIITFPLLLLSPVPDMPRLIDVGTLILLAAMCSSLTYVLYFRLVAEVGATLAISVEFAVTVVAVTIGALVLHEALTAMQFIGAVVIITGCSMVIGLIGPKRA